MNINPAPIWIFMGIVVLGVLVSFGNWLLERRKK